MNRFATLWFCTLLLKLLLAAFVPLSPDEAYYWIWSKNPQLSYFDHPPFVSWLLYLGHWFEGFGQLIRTPTVLVGHATMAVWYLILKPRFSFTEYKWWYFLALASPLIGFGSILATPDVAHIFFWSVGIYFFLKALHEKKTKDYLLLGAALGLGFCAKYHTVLFVPCAFAYLIFEKKLKEVSFKKLPWTVLSGFVFCLPVILWNVQNDFASFKYQLHHGFGATGWTPDWTLGYIAAEILLIFPWIFYVALRVRPEIPFRWLHYFAWGPLAFFLFSSFRGTVELNWPIAAFPAVFALVLFSPKAKKVITAGVVFFLLFYAVAFGSAIFLPAKSAFAKPFREPLRFRQLSPLQNEFQPLYAGTYQIAATLWWENKSPIYKLRDMSRFDFFDTLPGSLPQEDSFFLVQENWSKIPDWVEKAGYKTTVVKEIDPHYLVVKVFKE